jgi:hypothetical protein
MLRPPARTFAVIAFLFGVMSAQFIHGFTVVHAEEVPCMAPTELPPADVTPEQPPATPPFPPSIRLSEVLPDPAGKDTENEFIEMENFSDADVDLLGWKISDASGRTFTFAAMTVAARGYLSLLYAETKIPLVNAGGTLSLLDASGTVIDVVTYPAPVPEGESFARLNGAWQWRGLPTPGTANALIPPPIVDEPGMAQPPNEIAEPSPAPALPPAVVPNPEGGPQAPPPDDFTAEVSLSEFLPNPDGDDANEWIEVRNHGSVEARLSGWSVDDTDGGSAPYAFPSDATIPAGGYLVVRRQASRLSLNNDVDDVRLLAPGGVIRHVVHYEDAPSGKTFAFDGAAWRWTSPTPDAPNAFADDAVPPAAALVLPTPSATQAVPADEQSVIETTVEDAGELDDETAITLAAVVTLPPGFIGKTTFAIRDADGGHGALVRVRGKSPIPQLREGDAVTLRGRVRRENGTLLAVNAKDVTKTGRAPTISVEERDAGTVSESDVGLTVAVSGTVTAAGKGWVMIGSAGAESEIRALFPKGSSSVAVAGDQAKATGVIRYRSGKPELYLLGKESFSSKKSEETSDPAAEGGAEAKAQTIVLADSPKSPLVTAWSIAAVIGVGAALAAYAAWRRGRFA